MKTLRLMSILSLLAAITGCKSIPAVSAGKATYESAHPFGGTKIAVEGARVTDQRVEIDSYHRVSKWGWGGVVAVTQDVTVTDYARDRKPGETATVKTP